MIEEFVCFFSFSKIYHTALRETGSSPEVGSSKISNYGYPNNAIATLNLRLLPPESYLTFFLYYYYILSILIILDIVYSYSV
jgi:hypothetical protein